MFVVVDPWQTTAVTPRERVEVEVVRDKVLDEQLADSKEVADRLVKRDCQECMLNAWQQRSTSIVGYTLLRDVRNVHP
jgi:hypothetical protein